MRFRRSFGDKVSPKGAWRKPRSNVLHLILTHGGFLSIRSDDRDNSVLFSAIRPTNEVPFSKVILESP